MHTDGMDSVDSLMIIALLIALSALFSMAELSVAASRRVKLRQLLDRLAGEGLHPSSKGVRVKFSGSQRSVTDGPFIETKELIAGFWIFQVASLAECIEWVKRCPNPMPGDSEIEIRQIFEAEDFGDEFTPELREQEERLRARLDS